MARLTGDTTGILKDRRRDSKGRLIALCKHGFGEGCATRAQWAIEGFGAFGLYHGTRATYCKRHAAQHAASMNRSTAGRGTYKAVRVTVR